MATPLDLLHDAGIQHCLHGYSALDRYFRVREPGNVFVLADTSLIGVARVFDELEFGAGPLADASVVHEGTRYCLKCDDDGQVRNPFTVLHLRYDARRDVFLDPRDVYPDLRKNTLQSADWDAPEYQVLMETARIVSRYHYRVDGDGGFRISGYPPISATEQRELLNAVLSGRHSREGLTLLASAGFVEEYWPELAELQGISHAKEYHPEGDVWQHTLETLTHRKTTSLRLSLALLFHDAGKAVASPAGPRRFDGHADLGVPIARRFLHRLEYQNELIDEVCFLIRYHMIPAALKRLPEHRTAPLMSSPLFPDLLGVYYADLSSSYRSPEGYYEACRIYRKYVRRRASPMSTTRRPSKKRSHFG